MSRCAASPAARKAGVPGPPAPFTRMPPAEKKSAAVAAVLSGRVKLNTVPSPLVMRKSLIAAVVSPTGSVPCTVTSKAPSVPLPTFCTVVAMRAVSAPSAPMTFRFSRVPMLVGIAPVNGLPAVPAAAKVPVGSAGVPRPSAVKPPVLAAPASLTSDTTPVLSTRLGSDSVTWLIADCAIVVCDEVP